MPVFSVLLFTASPAGQVHETGGAFVKIDAREALLRSAELFLNRDNVKQIQLCFLPDDTEEGKRKYGAHLGFSGVKVISAGPRWIDQVMAGAARLSPDATHVILHDAARPAVPFDDIDALLAAAAKRPAVALAAALNSQLVEIDEGGNPLAIQSPAQFRQLLFPQAFTRAKFLEIVAAKQMPHASQFSLVDASPLNHRVTGSGDASVTKALLGLLPRRKSHAPTNPFEEAQW